MQGLLPKRLRVLRAERGLTIKQAAESASVTRETLRELELGRRTPHEPTLAKIANAYDVSVAELLEAAEVEPDPLADAPRSSSELESPRRNPDLERLSSNLRDRIRDFLQRWLEVGNYLKRPEGKIPGSHVWHLEQHRNVTREAAILLRDVVELGDYAGVASNVPQLIHATAEKVRLGADLAVARAQLEQAAAWALLQQEIAYDLAKTKQKEEDEYAKVVSLTVERERRRPPDFDDTATARGAG